MRTSRNLAGAARRSAIIASWLIAALGSAAAMAAELQGMPKGRLGTQAPDLSFPSVGRVVFGFLVTVGLAVGAAYVLRRWWPTFSRRRATATSIRVIDRTVVSTSLSAYLLEVEGERFLVAEGRSGISLTRVRSATESATQ